MLPWTCRGEPPRLEGQTDGQIFTCYQTQQHVPSYRWQCHGLGCAPPTFYSLLTSGSLIDISMRANVHNYSGHFPTSFSEVSFTHFWCPLSRGLFLSGVQIPPAPPILVSSSPSLWYDIIALSGSVLMTKSFTASVTEPSILFFMRNITWGLYQGKHPHAEAVGCPKLSSETCRLLFWRSQCSSSSENDQVMLEVHLFIWSVLCKHPALVCSLLIPSSWPLSVRRTWAGWAPFTCFFDTFISNPSPKPQ